MGDPGHVCGIGKGFDQSLSGHVKEVASFLRSDPPDDTGIWSETIRARMDGVVTSEGVARSIYGGNARQHEGESAAIVRDDIEDLRGKKGGGSAERIVNEALAELFNGKCRLTPNCDTNPGRS